MEADNFCCDSSPDFLLAFFQSLILPSRDPKLRDRRHLFEVFYCSEYVFPPAASIIPRVV